MKRFLFSLFVFSVTFFWSPGDGACGQRHHLFFIERSKNKNIVQYDIRTMEDGNLAGKAPVVAYWILENGEERELSVIQREFAYGIESQKKLGKDQYEVVLTALKKRKITVKKTDDGYKAFVMIDGRERILERVYVESRERLIGLPKVLFIDLFGRDGQTNLPITERIFPR